MEKIKTIRGVRDICYPRSSVWDKIEKICSSVLEGYAYRRIHIPVIEFTSLFSRSIGEETDIVSKEMYAFKDRKGRDIALRPEGTAGVVRAVIENNLLQGSSREKLYYSGPMFRYERPQEGRYRQFYQIGCEVFGSRQPETDAETAAAALEIARKCGAGGLDLRVNSVGCDECRPPYRRKVADFLAENSGELCEDCMRRKDTNTLRVLDCKKNKCRSVFKNIPVLKESLCSPCAEYYSDYRSLLEALGCSFTEDTGLVRGLDYYTGPVFELEADKGGVIAAGGRYDGLVKKLGGPDIPACGWAFGLERLESASDITASRLPAVYIMLMPGGDAGLCRSAAAALRKSGVSVEENYEDISPGKKLKDADRKGAGWALFVGEEETVKGFYSLKNLMTGEQRKVPGDELEKVSREFACE